MRIISQFHDYYDGAQGAGIDTTLVYQRTTTPVLMRDDMQSLVPNTPDLEWNIYRQCDAGALFPLTLVFCGRCYPGAHFQRAGEDHCFFSADAVDVFLRAHHITHFNLDKVSRWRKEVIPMRRFLANTGEPASRAVVETIEANRWPILVYAPSLYGKATPMMRDVCLKDLGFFRVVDAYTAFQDIAQFLARLAAPENQAPVQIQDADMVRAKGFDQWSFRKLPSKRR